MEKIIGKQPTVSSQHLAIVGSCQRNVLPGWKRRASARRNQAPREIGFSHGTQAATRAKARLRHRLAARLKPCPSTESMRPCSFVVVSVFAVGISEGPASHFGPSQAPCDGCTCVLLRRDYSKGKQGHLTAGGSPNGGNCWSRSPRTHRGFQQTSRAGKRSLQRRG